MGHHPVNNRLLPAFLIITCLVPVGFGSYRAAVLALDFDWALQFAADHVDRLPLFLHVIGACGFLILCALQLWPGLRQRRPGLHRKTGRTAVVLGLIGAVSGLWMTLAHPDISSALLFWGRLGASIGWGGCIVLGLIAVRRRHFQTHRAWMIRAYALALPAGTLAFILLPIVLIFGEQSEFVGEVIQVAAWPVHLAIAEILARRAENAPRRLTYEGAIA